MAAVETARRTASTSARRNRGIFMGTGISFAPDKRQVPVASPTHARRQDGPYLLRTCPLDTFTERDPVMPRTIWLAIAIPITLAALPRIAAAQEQPAPRGAVHACPAGEECPKPPDHEAMKARHEAMMEQHEEAAVGMQELQDRMHAATGEAKIDAMAALLDEMLAQHRTMHEMMMGMHRPMGMDHEGMKQEGPDDHDDHR